nr:ATP-binding protein [Paenibacillus anaericanus]
MRRSRSTLELLNILKQYGEWGIGLINKFWVFISGKRSISAQLIWVIFISFIITNIVFSIIPHDINELIRLLIFIGIYIVCFIILTRNIVKNLSQLSNGLMVIARGDLNYRLPISRLDELGAVAQNVNHMAEQLQKQVERERQLESSKMELITNVSHDLRTPLTSIIGYLDLLKKQAFQDENERERYINNAFNKTQQLKKLIDDLFEYTRLSYGDTQMNLQEVDFHSLIEQMASEFEPVAREQGINLIKALSPDPIFMRIDVEKIVRAIDNLLMNALKFSLVPGEIRINLFSQGRVVKLSIENHGNPITKEQEEQLFERFYTMQPSQSEVNLPSGYGLGLSIAKSIVELQGGRIWLEHNEGYYRFNIELNRSVTKEEG